MVLLYLALAYFAGILGGRFAWDVGWIGCEFPHWLWWGPALLLPFTPLLNRLHATKQADAALVWPRSAGFSPPRTQPWTPALLAALALCMVTGALRYAARPLTPCWTETDLAYYNLPADQAFVRDAPTVIVEGYVDSYPLLAGTEQRLVVRTTSLTGAGRVQPVKGELRLTTGIETRYVYGQPLRLRGRLVTPPDFEDFSFREYLARKGVHSLMYGTRITPMDAPPAGNRLLTVVYALRARGERVLNQLLPEPYAALANGMLLGIEAGIPEDLYDQFNLTGTSHVIVISGSNVALISGVLLALFARVLGRRRAVYPTLVGIALYALLVGGDAAVMRAALMGGLFVWAVALNRRSTALVSLAAACWAMTLVNPLTLWDVGFQLSSAATAGLILFSPAITDGFQRFVPGFGGLLAGENAACRRRARRSTQLSNRRPRPHAQPGAGPAGGRPARHPRRQRHDPAPGRLLLWALESGQPSDQSAHFPGSTVHHALGQSGGVLAGVAGLRWLAQALLWIPWLSLVWTVAMVRVDRGSARRQPGGCAVRTGRAAADLCAHLWPALAASSWRRAVASWSGACVAGGFVRLLSPALAGALAVIALLVWRMALTQPDGRLHVHFLDIGQGDGILITTPSGRQALIDGGAEPERLLAELGAVMPFWDRSLDLLLLTHPDADHMAAQAQRARTLSGRPRAGDADQPGQPGCARAGASTSHAPAQRVHVQEAGGWVDLGDGVALWVLWPPPGGFEHEHADNENSLVVKLVYGDFSVLLTGDAGLPSEAVLAACWRAHRIDRAQGGPSRQPERFRRRLRGRGDADPGRNSGRRGERLRPSSCGRAGKSGRHSRAAHRPARPRASLERWETALGEDGAGRA